MIDSNLSSSDIQAIKHMMERWTTLLVKRDWLNWQTHWAEDGVLMPPDHERVVGRDNLVDFAANSFDVVKSYQFSNWTFDGKDQLAVVTNTIAVEFEEQDTSALNQMLLLGKAADGQWLVQKVIFNGDG
ncbi:MAG: DUF4440 domain-containing protein [Pseudomonadota bacterium]